MSRISNVIDHGWNVILAQFVETVVKELLHVIRIVWVQADVPAAILTKAVVADPNIVTQFGEVLGHWLVQICDETLGIGANAVLHKDSRPPSIFINSMQSKDESIFSSDVVGLKVQAISLYNFLNRPISIRMRLGQGIKVRLYQSPKPLVYILFVVQYLARAPPRYLAHSSHSQYSRSCWPRPPADA
jgi:hypothetical protein